MTGHHSPQTAFTFPNPGKALLTAGVDEAGRGPLAGPVVAAAVILDPSRPIVGLNDSKALKHERRVELAALIRERAQGWAIAIASSQEIDTINILQASLLAMQRAVEQLSTAPELALVDGNRCPGLRMPAQAIIRGDATVAAISAASILAKVYRDELMCSLHNDYPLYNFAAHKGYGTPAHLTALRTHGPCPEHRRSFAPVRVLLAEEVV